MNKHTREPWRVEEGTTLIWGACNPDDMTTWGMGYPVCDARRSGFRSSEDEMIANAYRIVACVNACAGIPSPSLEAGAAEKARTALGKCAGVLSGDEMSKSALIDALQETREALALLSQESPDGE